MLSVDLRAIWSLRDLIHHYGEWHPAVRGTDAGRTISLIGSAIPALAGDGVLLCAEELASHFVAHGYDEVTLRNAFAVLGVLMNPR
jgi:hypothetical protein